MRSTYKLPLSSALFLMMLFSIFNAFGQGIEFFSGTFEEAQTKAKKEQKLIFVDAYAAWCGPCKRMARTVFPNEELGAYYNTNFINMKIDAEKGLGRNFASTYNVRAYPTMFFLDDEGAVVSRILGARNAQALLQEGKKAMQGSPNPLNSFKEQYEGGDRSESFLFDYLNALHQADEEYEFILAEYLVTQSNEEKQAPKNVELVFELTKSMISPGYPYLIQIEPQVIERKGREKYHSKLRQISYNSVIAASETEDETLFKNAQELLKEKAVPDFKSGQMENAMAYYERTANWKKFARTASKYVKKHASDDVDEMSLLAWKFHDNLDQRKYIRRALKWSGKAVAMEDNYDNNDLRAHLLYKSGELAEAKLAAEHAISKARAMGVNDQKAQNLLDKIREERPQEESMR